MNKLTIRPAMPSDAPQLKGAVIELQDHERRLHATRLPGALIADAYLAWMQQQANESGALLVAEIEGTFAGFAAGWIAQEDSIAETQDSNSFGYISDICVLAPYRGRRIAAALLEHLENHLARAGVTRIRIGSLAANKPARACYERAGFTAYEVIYEKVIGGRDAP
jgi:ribosomal protein S18 acetylase RimI-like enzyme